MDTFRQARRLATICVLALVVSACGGSGGDGDDESLQPLSVGLTTFNSLHLPILMARDEKLMEPFGIDLEINTFQNTGQIIPALLSGSLDIGTATPEQMFAAQDEEPELKMICSEVSTNPYSLIVSPNIKTIDDLKGKTIGVTGIGASADYFTAVLMLEDAGLKEKQDYTFINAGPPAQRATALIEGQVDAVMSFEPDAQKLVDKGMKSIAEASELDNLHDVIIAMYMAKQGWYEDEDNHELAVDFFRGYLASVEWLYDPANKSRAVDIIAKQMKVSDKAATATYDKFVTELKAYPKDGRIDPAFLETTAKNAKIAGVKAAPAIDSLPDRYDNSLVEEAAKQK
ncbi:MAG: PhnD/SsuA/transferrin family substrate-binding protein [Streptosporangiales bacterium]|nr:PhnD/SsuA/transferrin family substrate-binding protein [Streptosporangiales bacterium]